MEKSIEVMENNCERIKISYYTGRTIIMGMSPNNKNIIQLYWTVGRSKNSQNRYLLKDGECIKTEPIRKDENILYPELLMYNIARQIDNNYIISNGTQTDEIYDCLSRNKKFENAIENMLFEHDKPIYTPRISGLVKLHQEKPILKFGIVKTVDQNPEIILRHVYSFTNTSPGVGYCIHTYDFGNECKPFSGEPYPVKTFDELDELVDFYWNLISLDKRVGLYARFINLEDGTISERIMNERF